VTRGHRSQGLHGRRQLVTRGHRSQDVQGRWQLVMTRRRTRGLPPRCHVALHESALLREGTPCALSTAAVMPHVLLMHAHRCALRASVLGHCAQACVGTVRGVTPGCLSRRAKYATRRARTDLASSSLRTTEMRAACLACETDCGRGTTSHLEIRAAELNEAARAGRAGPAAHRLHLRPTF